MNTFMEEKLGQMDAERLQRLRQMAEKLAAGPSNTRGLRRSRSRNDT
jgi:hypothetical protein